MLVLGLIKLSILGPDSTTLDLGDGYAAFALVPFSVTFMYFMAVFSFGLAGDLAARQSIYPPRMFTLPVTTAALAGWPMLYGTAAMAMLWLVMRILARWPWQMELPVVWPGFLGAVVLAWTQVFMWMPYGLRGLRVIARRARADHARHRRDPRDQLRLVRGERSLRSWRRSSRSRTCARVSPSRGRAAASCPTGRCSRGPPTARTKPPFRPAAPRSSGSSGGATADRCR